MSMDLAKEGLSLLSKDSWLYRYLQYTKNQESPTKFHIWSAISTLASCIGRKTWLYRGYYMLYANQYIILVAESALCRKSTSSDIAIDDLLTSSDAVDIIREKMTTEFLCKELSSTERINNEVLIYAPELATFLGANAFHSGLIPTLTSLYGCPATRDYKTKESGVFNLSNVCINILGCTTLDWMSTNMPGDTIEGGFTGRVIFIVEEEPRLKNAWPSLTDQEIALRKELIFELTQIGKIHGEFHVTDLAKVKYEKWYNHTKEFADIRLRSYGGRKGDHVLKIAMVLAAADYKQANGELLITDKLIEISLSLLESAELLMPLAFRGAAYSKSSKDIDRILRQLEKMGGSERKEIAHHTLLKRNAHYLNSTEFKEVIKSLEEMRSISVTVRGKGTYYKLR